MASRVKKGIKAVGVAVVAGAAILAYNYLRFGIFWLPTEPVEFASDPGIIIRGTLVKPQAKGVFPAVVVLHGSGPETRQEISYRIIANTIARSGVAVLLYDKRGAGESDGDYEATKFSDLVADAVAAVDYLAAREDIDQNNIALLGNSQSGWLTPEIARKSGRVARIMNRAGPSLPWMENVIWEVRNDLLADGVPEAELGPLLDLVRRRWQFYVAAASDPALAFGPQRDSINAETKVLLAKVPAAGKRIPQELAAYSADVYQATAAELSYDPQPFLETIDIPILYVFAENDINVPTAASVTYLESLRETQGKDIDIVVFGGVGHAMMNWTGLFTAGYIPEFMHLLEHWFATQAAN